MKTRDFSFDLPPELIAQFPPERRGDSRMLVLDRGDSSITHSSVSSLPDFLEEGTVMVFNDSRVRKARIFGEADTGGKVEFLLLEERTPGVWEAIVEKSKKQRIGKEYAFPGGMSGKIAASEGNRKIVMFDPPPDEGYFERFGHMPLPPYIKREDQSSDALRYQTIYSHETGSVAAPTAGLHFTEGILSALAARGIQVCYVTLHVGIGTFLPMRTEEVESHTMHRESYLIPEETARLVNLAKSEGRPVCAVGTTSVRTLESGRREEGLAAGPGNTSLFIYPGYRFGIVDRMFTNFHTPESTLLVMVSAFAGSELIKTAYAAAIENRYRFFSYGDCMLIR